MEIAIVKEVIAANLPYKKPRFKKSLAVAKLVVKIGIKNVNALFEPKCNDIKYQKPRLSSSFFRLL